MRDPLSMPPSTREKLIRTSPLIIAGSGSLSRTEVSQPQCRWRDGLR